MKLAITILTIGVLAAAGADLQRGENFVNGQHLTASQLHDLVDDAIILPGFYTDKTTKYTLLSADKLLVYSPALAAYRVVSVGSLLYTNSDYVTGQSEKTTPVAGDYVVIFDSAAGVLKKATLGNLAVTTTNLINGQPVESLADLEGRLLVLQGGTNAAITLSNLYRIFRYYAPITNLTAHYAPTNLDQLLIFDSVAGTNKTITLSNLVDRLPANLSPDPARDALMTTTASNMAKVTVSTLTATLSNSLVRRFVSDLFPGTAITNVPHNLGGTPQEVRWVWVCTNADARGFKVGDEVSLHSFRDTSAAELVAAAGASSTSVWVSVYTGVGTVVQSMNKTNGAATTAVSLPNFNLKCYATYYP